jgi:hypothetical protein
MLTKQIKKPFAFQSDMYEALHEGVRVIEVDNWLQVIPQLIARIDTPRPLVGRLIHQVTHFATMKLQ